MSMKVNALIALDYCERSSFPNVWTCIRRTLLHGQNDDVPNHGYVDPAQHSKSHGSYEGARIFQVLLKGVD